MPLTLYSASSPFPYAAAAAASFYKKVEVTFEDGTSGAQLQAEGGTLITNELAIVKALAASADDSASGSKVPEFLEASEHLAKATAVPEIMTILNKVDDHLAYRTYIAGHSLATVDWVLWGSIKGNVKIIGLLKNNKHVHLSRWLSHIEALESTQVVLAKFAEAKASKLRSNKTAASFAMGLQNAKEGQVVTRFPPEPSGYLHIGHTKAAMLNQYFAKMYKGKLLIRFDDTNPTKERSEFEETILEDLRLLDIEGDSVSHTSDYFDQLYDLCVKMINLGKAYADDTEQLKMREERGNGTASSRRDCTIEENLSRFEEMKKGTPEGLRWCIRAKISVDNPNKAMRDPVIYRCNVMPHHRTGDRWKIYPTYDFACPVVDSVEGVTHALRTNEYRDRNPQYNWMIEALNLRTVDIWDFSRLNFIYTLLSKRKLHWFVDQNLVRGWDDPRFPTVRGIRRRGLTVEALRQFMLLQGPSQAVVSLEWDLIWALNKKIIDPIAPRFWALSKPKLVPVMINGGSPNIEVKTVPKHKKNPEVGEKQTVYASAIFVEQEDALSFDDQEEITLMDWGNAIVRSKQLDGSGSVTALEMDLNLEGDFRKTKKKITWLAQPTTEHPLVDVVLLDYDYIISKKKLEEGDDVAEFVTPVTEFRETAYADANVVSLKKGDIIQFERKGYYILDNAPEGGHDLEFIHIPDGRAASLASKATSASAAPASQGKPGTTVPVDTKMYSVAEVYGDDIVPEAETKMYRVANIYDS